MTLEEARKVAAICMTADGGCTVCVSSLARQLQERFPEFTWTYDENAPMVEVFDADDTEMEWGRSYRPILVEHDAVSEAPK